MASLLIEQFITNAVKYTFEPNKKIYISVMQKEHQVHLFIRDEGIGVPKSDLSRITKAFIRVKMVGKQENLLEWGSILQRKYAIS